MVKRADDASQYNEDSIQSLKGADRVRKRPAVIFGSSGLEGCEHSFFEILANAVDEARDGYGNEITVTVWQNGDLQVEDAGRGVPLGWNEREGRYNWDLVFCELYAGGKYKAGGEGLYDFSLGMNGLGACATQYSSEYMTVKSYKNGELSEISFKAGSPATELSVTPIPAGDKKKTGTVIKWKPDSEVFTETAIPSEFFVSTLRDQAVVNAGIRFVLRYENENGKTESEEFYYEHGILDYMEEVTDGKALTAPFSWKLDTFGKERADKQENHLVAEIAFCMSTEANRCLYYHNSSFLSNGGSPDTAVKRAFSFMVDKYLKDNGKYRKNDSDVVFDDIGKSLFLIINSSSRETSFENQTKKSITDKFIGSALYESIKYQLQIFFTERPDDAQKFALEALNNARIRTRKDMDAVPVPVIQPMNAMNRVEKFVNCRSKDATKRELYIVEGDSALTSVKLARDAEFQAVIPVRGKTLNCMKATYQQIFKSTVITDLIRVIGCGVEIESKDKDKEGISSFNLGALPWSKIVICTDADEDGFQIRTLILTLFYRLMPTLLQEKKVFVAESPLFEISTKDDTYFAYNEWEKKDILEKLGDTKYSMQRSKGLGENEPDMMWRTTMNPATRRLISVMPADPAETLRMFDTLLGDAIDERKKFIAENGARYMKDADVS